MVVVILAVLLQGMRHLRTWHWEGKPTGLFLVRATVVMCILMMPVEARMRHAYEPNVAGSGAAVPLVRTA